jgi:hypothetical protein
MDLGRDRRVHASAVVEPGRRTFSNESWFGMEEAAHLGRRFGADLTLVHVHDRTPPPPRQASGVITRKRGDST